MKVKANKSSTKACEICGCSIHPLSYCCKRCKKLIDRINPRQKHDKNARIRALKQAWDGEGFRCHYSGVRLVEDKHQDPRYLTFDHRTPRRENDIVVAASLLNDMKSDMTEDEFKAMVIQLANRFQGGDIVKEEFFNLESWKR